MKIYEVGGAVRDALLGDAVDEHDWVVVGARPAELEQLGFRRVGKDFPVFIHPDTGEEYALARRERKIAPGHSGFEFDTTASVTLEEDLGRRDLTINAIARDADGTLIDPHGGLDDLRGRVLRHISDAFREDPLRVLRVARFAAKLAPREFTVAAQTLELMRRMVEGGELETLVPERVWQETQKALETTRPDVYFATLRACGALARVFPEIEKLFGVPQPERWHPEIDTGVHTLLALRCAAQLTASTAARFAVLTHDFGKAETPRALWPRHSGHGERSARIIERFCKRLPVPRKFETLAVHVARHHGVVHRASELKPGTMLELLTAVDALRRPERLEEFLLACEADARGRTGLEDRPYPQGDLVRLAQAAALGVSAATVRDGALDGPALGAAIRQARIAAIGRALAGQAQRPP